MPSYISVHQKESPQSERPVLTLKRRPAAETTTSEASGETAPVLRRRKTVVMATPDPRKLKKQAQKEAEKAAEEEWRRQWLLKDTQPVKQPKAPARPPRPVRLMPVEDALGMLADC
ncbi:hypothetical protein C1B77_22570 [Salmonella enterica]|nr:hypothetical protein [Salmonella enterica]